MVNYLYDLDDIEKNHEAYAEGRRVVASNAVKRLLRRRGGRACAGAGRDNSGFPSIARGLMLRRCRVEATRPP